MKILVTGATGFIGNNLSNYLIKNGYQVYHTCMSNENTTGGSCLGSDFANIDWKTVGKIDAVLHQAAITDTLITDRKRMMQVNLLDSLTLFNQAIDQGCKVIVYASSCAVYGDAPAPFVEDGHKNPLNVYAESKHQLDDEAMKLNSKDVTVVGLRYSNVYGPGEKHKLHSASMVYQLAQQMKNGQAKLFEFGEQKRDFVCVDDVIAANMEALRGQVKGIFNCGSGVARSFNDIIGILNKLLKTSIKPTYIKNPHEKFYQNLTECNMQKSANQLGHKPKYTLEQGIAAYYDSGLLV
jgi:ADP-L-glycero-D-manno-heptose 6-epimerase